MNTERRQSRPQRRLLARGEETIASAGLMLAATLLVLIGASAWWSARLHRNAQQEARRHNVQSVGSLLAESCTALISANELSSTRRLIMEAQRVHDLTECRIVLADGVLAHSDPSRISVHQLPAIWSDAQVVGQAPTPAPGELGSSYTLEIPGRGTARLDITARLEPTAMTRWDAYAGVALIGAVALAALLFTYRRMRSRMQAVAAIRESLQALTAGESSAAALAVPVHLGPDAAAWNSLISDREKLEKQLLGRRVGEVLAHRTGGHGELDNACNVMREGLILVARDMRVTYANGAAAVYMGTKKDTLVGGPVADFISDEKTLSAIRDVVSGASRTWVWVEVGELGEAEGSVLRFSIRPIRHDDSGDAVIVISDITQQRVAEVSRQAFVDNITHELGNPLTTICLATENIIDLGDEDPEQRRHFLNIINQCTRRLQRAVKDMLSVAEMEAGKYELKLDDVRLDAVFEELNIDFGAQASAKNIEFTIELPPKLPVINADREKLGLAFHNLLGNAIKYTPEHGRVTVTVAADDDSLTVEIIDNGMGIPEDDLPRVFDKFHRAVNAKNSKTAGTGIGLALTREIVQMHGGEIEVDSALNQGSRFTMHLPAGGRVAA